jgi:23S rRNA pseudouridine1911/1915/1917 synthase
MRISRLDILYEDAHCLVVSKPAGLPTQGLNTATLEGAVRRHLNPDDPAQPYLATVHRLDRPVSGVMVWAKTPKAARRLADQFAQREVRKEYWALVEGRPESNQGVWEDWLCTEATGLGRVQVCRPGTPRARRALTHFRLGEVHELPSDRSWLILSPETGRTHQLRIQASSRGLPVLGDRDYGARLDFPEGIALHARALTMLHPILRQPLTIEAPPPESWRGYRLRGDS